MGLVPIVNPFYTPCPGRFIKSGSENSDLATFTRFVRLCAGRTAQEVNLSQLGSDSGVSHNTARAWLGAHPLPGALLETLVTSELLKWHLHRGLRADLQHYREV